MGGERERSLRLSRRARAERAGQATVRTRSQTAKTCSGGCNSSATMWTEVTLARPKWLTPFPAELDEVLLALFASESFPSLLPSSPSFKSWNRACCTKYYIVLVYNSSLPSPLPGYATSRSVAFSSPSSSLLSASRLFTGLYQPTNTRPRK